MVTLRSRKVHNGPKKGDELYSLHLDSVSVCEYIGSRLDAYNKYGA
jgi:hypothetical protein